MRGKLVRSGALFDVPKDLTYFVHDDEFLVVNPEAGARCVLNPHEFRVLQTLAGGGSTPLEETDETERALAPGEPVLSWIVYFNGNRPNVRSAKHHSATSTTPSPMAAICAARTVTPPRRSACRAS